MCPLTLSLDVFLQVLTRTPGINCLSSYPATYRRFDEHGSFTAHRAAWPNDVHLISLNMDNTMPFAIVLIASRIHPIE